MIIKNIANTKIKNIFLFIFYLPSFILSIPIQILIIILYPFIRFRFGKIIVDRLGHLAIETEMYLCENKKKNIVDIWFYNKKNVSNHYLLKLFSKHLTILPRYIIAPLYYINLFIPGGKKYLIPRSYNPSRDIDGLIANSKKKLSIPLSDMKIGIKKLRKIGVNNPRKIVCLSVRDQAYLKSRFPKMNWKKDEFRNPNINNYHKVIKQLSLDGYYVFRMGALVQTKLNYTNDKIIDYANSNIRSDFMDIFLFYICRFAIGGTEGLMQLPIIFRKPIAFVNVMQFGYLLSFCQKSVTLPTKFINKLSNNMLNYDEVLRIKFLKTEDFNNNYKIVENTPEEIFYAVYELIEFIENNFQNMDVVEYKEKMFWKKLILLRDENKKIIHNKIFTKISKIFFYNYKNFL